MQLLLANTTAMERVFDKRLLAHSLSVCCWDAAAGIP
jgi:hypothetical protein